MKECPECHRSFPDHLIQPMVSDKSSRDMCPICALWIRNKEMGLPINTPFQGEIAQGMYEEAVEFLEGKKLLTMRNG